MSNLGSDHDLGNGFRSLFVNIHRVSKKILGFWFSSNFVDILSFFVSLRIFSVLYLLCFMILLFCFSSH